MGQNFEDTVDNSMRKTNWSLITKLVIPVFIAIIAGCANQQPSDPNSTDTQTGVTEGEERINQQLLAIEALIDQQQIDQATLLLDGLEFDQMNTAQQTRYILAYAQASLAIGDGQQALFWLSGEYAYLFDGLPLEDQISISLNRATANELAGKPLAAARERIFLAPLLSGDEATLNQEQIWYNLQLVPEDQIRTLAERESSPDLNGWLTLALVGQTRTDDLYQLLAAIEQWQQENPAHPAAKELPASLKILKEIVAMQPTHVGVLLPLSGPLEKAGVAIRDGILTAWYHAKENDQTVPELSFFDTASTDSVVNLYKQAITSGVQVVIGPLAKSKVLQLSQADSFPIPVLALNYADTNDRKRDNFYQFGLAPEDEAIQIANDIWQDGVRNVLVLAPNSDWGKRVSDAFIETWQSHGGLISNKSLFTANRPDQYLNAIKSALNITNSEQRHLQLQRELDSTLEFETRRRQDIDAVFMLAFPAQGRQLKPILDYQRASDIPIVATSSVYSGVRDTSRDKDIEGIRFVETPWRLTDNELKTQINGVFPDSLSSYASLVALGIDAFKIYPRLPQMAVFSDVRVAGNTGTLAMSDLGKVQRTLDWAVITNGVAVEMTNREYVDAP